MVSPHAASLQQPVTYTRASCEISEGGGELTKMHIPAAAQLSPPPLQPSSGSLALPAPPKAFPACCHRGRSTLWLFREGRRLCLPRLQEMREHHASCTGWRLLDAACRSRSGLQISLGGTP